MKWVVIVKSWANKPVVATEILLKRVLPLDPEYTRNMSYKKLIDILIISVATISS